MTPRKVDLPNSLEALNRLFNARLHAGVVEANRRQSEVEDLASDAFCNEEDLYVELRKAIFQSFTASWGLKGYGLDRQLRELLVENSYSLSLNDSIYRDIDYLEGLSLNLKQLSDVVRVNGHLVGLDKFGHFFAEGYQYFELTEENGETLTEAMLWGREQEQGKFGYATTGIFSFADLVANFQGWRFWNSIRRKHDDPLTGFWTNLLSGPRISCSVQIIDSIRYRKIVKKWQMHGRFDFSEYIDGMWDEGNNCNSYADPIVEKKVTARILQVDPDFSCPTNPGSCEQAHTRYGSFGKYLIHPWCLTVKVQ
ncbi:MAG: hypothetical protein ACK5PS_19325 [Desulfopila sp.]